MIKCGLISSHLFSFRLSRRFFRVLVSVPFLLLVLLLVMILQESARLLLCRLLNSLKMLKPLKFRSLMPNELKYFAEEEFAKCTPPCKLSDMDSTFMLRLDGLRAACGFPFVLNCAYRSKEYDLKKSRSGYSYHCKGRAVDVKCLDGVKRAKIVQYAPAFGLRGIGVSSRFIHLDDRDYNCIWAYD